MSAMYSDSQIVSEVTRLGVETADAKNALAGNGESFQAALWSYYEKILNAERWVHICSEHARQLLTRCTAR